MPPVLAAIALGSNLGDRAAHIRAAIHSIAHLPGTSIVREGPTIENPAQSIPGTEPGGDYLNSAVLIRTELSPSDLLQHLHAIEQSRGRDRAREPRWGPRTLDLDIILYADRSVDLPGLRIPHPRMHERLFVLIPLAAIAPDMPVPGRGTVAHALEHLRTGGSGGRGC